MAAEQDFGGEQRPVGRAHDHDLVSHWPRSSWEFISGGSGGSAAEHKTPSDPAEPLFLVRFLPSQGRAGPTRMQSLTSPTSCKKPTACSPPCSKTTRLVRPVPGVIAPSISTVSGGPAIPP